MPTSVNPFHQDKWKVSFSNIPSLTGFEKMPLYDLYVKSVVIPDVNITEHFSDFQQYRIRHPVGKGNVDLSQLQITFKADENLENYYNLFTWMLNLRYGENINTDLIRKNTIKSIDVILLDNQKRKKGLLTFSNCYLLTLSSLSLDYGVVEEVSFTANFTYEEINLETNVANL